MNQPVYMDGHATTRVDPRVVEAMLPFFSDDYGNAASRHHRFGWRARDAVAEARSSVAKLIGASARELIFTSGATESNNLALKGVAEASRDRGNHIVTLETEHRAVLDPCARLAQQGVRVSYLPVRADGLVAPAALEAALGPETVLVSVMTANNEIGVLQPVPDLARIAASRGVPLHTDAAQAAGFVPIDVGASGVGLLSLTAHKLYGPKGAGALFVRRGVKVAALLDGGGHEAGLRSGTLNVPAIVGFGRAAEICRQELTGEAVRLSGLRDRLWETLRRSLSGVRVNGSMTARLPHNLNVSVEGVSGEQLLAGLSDGLLRGRLLLDPRRVVARAAGAGPRRRPRQGVDPLRPRPLQHRSRGRPRGRCAVRAGRTAARADTRLRGRRRRPAPRMALVAHVVGGTAAARRCRSDRAGRAGGVRRPSPPPPRDQALETTAPRSRGRSAIIFVGTRLRLEVAS